MRAHKQIALLVPSLMALLAFSTGGLGAQPVSNDPEQNKSAVSPIVPPAESAPVESTPVESAPTHEPSLQYDLLTTKATQFLSQGELQEAGDTIQLLLDNYPNDAMSNYLLGVLKQREGNFEDSEKAYRLAIERDPALIDAYLDLSTLYYDRQLFDNTLEILAPAALSDPDNGVVIFHQARAEQGLGQDDIAAPHFLRATLLTPSLSASAHYYAGLSFLRLNLYEDAEEAFDTVILESPDSEFAKLAQIGQKQARESQKENKKWDIFLNVSVQYDDNVRLDPSSGSVAGQGVGGSGDTRAVLYARGDYFFYKENPWKAGIGYTLYQNLHKELKQFNTQSHTPNLYLTHKSGFNETRVDYLYQFTFLDKTRYLESHSLRPTYTYTPRPTLSAQFYYLVASKDFLDSSQFQTNSERDALNNQTGLSTRISLGRTLAEIGYAFEFENAETSDWDFKGHHFTLGSQMRLPLSIRGEVGGDYTLNEYDHPHSLSQEGKARKDNIYTANLRLSRALSPQSDLSIDYTLNRNDSNLGIYDYTRQVYSLNYGWRF